MGKYQNIRISDHTTFWLFLCLQNSLKYFLFTGNICKIYFDIPKYLQMSVYKWFCCLFFSWSAFIYLLTYQKESNVIRLDFNFCRFLLPIFPNLNTKVPCFLAFYAFLFNMKFLEIVLSHSFC